MLKSLHPKASHVAHAYTAETPSASRSSDDGEPAGTAGSPALRALERASLIHTAVFVVRYFGGTKLGAGGLTRAYGAAARGAVGGLSVVEVVPSTSLSLSAEAGDVGAVYNAVSKAGGTVLREEYGEDGRAALIVSVEKARVEELRNAVGDGTGGRAGVEEVEGEGGD